MTNNYQEYEWTAITEADLLDQGGNGSSIGCGDSFTMPASATVCMSTKDNDYSLSGDSCRNENANDWSGQQAYIDGEAVGGQMYAESYHVLKGSDGQTYYMIEIEIEGHDAPGAGDDYFTFYGKVPPAGTELTVVNTCNVKGNWVDYKCLGAGDKIETGSISGTVFCDEDCDGINGEITVIPGCDYTIEAEDMYSSGFKVVEGAQASGGELVKLYCPGDYAALCTTFDGKSGVYDVKIRVQDENDGQSIIKLKIGGEIVEAIRLDGDSDGAGSNDGGFSTYVIKDVPIESGQDLTLKVRGDGGEFVRIDNIVLEGQDTQEVVSEPTKAGVTIKLVDLDGNVVATTVTDADGNYRFDDVLVGDYKIMGVAPDGTEFTIQDAGSDDTIDSDVDGNGMSGVISVTADSESDVDLGLCVKEESGSLSGRYFCDTDDDSLDNNNGDEPGIGGVLVTLLDENGDPIVDAGGNPVTQVTAADGSYQFTDLEPGVYGVKFEDPDGVLVGKELVAANVGTDDTSDSDAIGDTTMSVIENIEVVADNDTGDNDAGVRDSDPGTAELGDTVWLDVFGDGILNDEALDSFFSGREQGVQGVTVHLLAPDGTILDQQVTDADGKYLFTGLKAGDYKVGFILPAGFAFTAANQGADDARDSDAVTMPGDPDYAMTQVVSLAEGESNLTLDAGLLRCGLIEGTSQADENSPVGGFDLLVGCETNDTIIGFSGEDTLIGNGGDDVLNGDSYDDLLEGGEGNDDLNGGSENDILIGGAGNDDLNGDGEVDTAVFGGNYADATIEIVDLFTGELTVTSVDGVDRVRNVEFLQFDDVTVAVEALLPGGTGDAVTAPAPGGSVNIDVLANDIELSEGTLSVAQVNDGGFGTVVIEGDGTVTYTAGANFEGFDFFTYTVTNGVGFVRTVEVQVGDVPTLDPADPGVTVLVEAPGDNGVTFDGTGGSDNILGTRGEDVINGLGGNDVIDGGRGDDNLRGAAGFDTLLGGEGDDTINADGQGDVALGGIGDDVLNGQFDDDILFGGLGDDFVRGLQGSDFVSGGAGDDRFQSPNSGADTILGGSGSDEFVWAEATDAGERDFLDGESGIDTLEISLDGADALAVQAEIDVYLAMVDANAPAPGSINDGSVLTDTFSFTTIDLDIRNIEDVQLI
ncbi:SdrD B-like domain-containing protein [Ruegeria sp. 2205SS24-7]|uniref:SdrD B-like domain-containing protein n=1 Tax=Ruegeria discodermiae TaxID=3064389 RepID=UPI0027412CA5|nr:SdrD B-like domain-containing protein [Ruegeria sp. 2205SS24-7]MDP5220671.1 SdrD B-like domain-containing protein [Ruegeria sp. 2205SS24-7]